MGLLDATLTKVGPSASIVPTCCLEAKWTHTWTSTFGARDGRYTREVDPVYTVAVSKVGQVLENGNDGVSQVLKGKTPR